MTSSEQNDAIIALAVVLREWIIDRLAKSTNRKRKFPETLNLNVSTFKRYVLEIHPELAIYVAMLESFAISEFHELADQTYLVDGKNFAFQGRKIDVYYNYLQAKFHINLTMTGETV